jgi:hypothetical protein
MKTMVTEHGTVRYLNSGDWIENLTALEYHNTEWKLYRYQDDPVAKSVLLKNNQIRKQSSKELFDSLLAEMKIRG